MIPPLLLLPRAVVRSPPPPPPIPGLPALLGTGVPVSEDVLLIFLGTTLGSTDIALSHKLASVAWCYAGVVASDYVRLSFSSSRRSRSRHPRGSLRGRPYPLPAFGCRHGVARRGGRRVPSPRDLHTVLACPGSAASSGQSRVEV